jgi:hypothetical protein
VRKAGHVFVEREELHAGRHVPIGERDRVFLGEQRIVRWVGVVPPIALVQVYSVRVTRPDEHLMR